MLPNMERWHECSQGFTENSYSVACWMEVFVYVWGAGGGWEGTGQVVIWTNDTIFKASCETDFTSKMTLHASFSIYANSTFPFNSLSSETPVICERASHASLLPSSTDWPPLGSSGIYPTQSTCSATAALGIFLLNHHQGLSLSSG